MADESLIREAARLVADSRRSLDDWFGIYAELREFGVILDDEEQTAVVAAAKELRAKRERILQEARAA